jgi:hypothetical protein
MTFWFFCHFWVYIVQQLNRGIGTALNKSTFILAEQSSFPHNYDDISFKEYKLLYLNAFKGNFLEKDYFYFNCSFA